MALLEDIQLGAVNGDDPDKKLESVVKQVNEWGRVLSNEGLTQIFKDDSGTNRVLLGKDSAGDYVLKVSQEGNDVYTATNDQLVFNSNNNMFKIVVSGSETQELTHTANTVASGLQTKTIAHNLGYVPTFLCYMTAPAGFIDGAILFMLPHTTNDGSGVGIFTNFYASADTTNLYIQYRHRSNTDYSPSKPQFTVRYYLMQETAI